MRAISWFAVLFLGALSFANAEEEISGKPAGPKNVILLIGDGMGPQQIGLLLTYGKLAPNSIYAGKEIQIEEIMNEGQTGLSLTHPADKIVVDSACSATQLATGHISGSEMIGLDAEGHRVETILEVAKKQGRKVGLVSDTRITHATPAAFASHQAHRSMESEMVIQMLETDVDVMMSGGLEFWLPKSIRKNEKLKAKYEKLTKGSIRITSRRNDERDMIAQAQQQGYTTVFERNAMADAKGKVLGLFAESGMIDGIANTKHRNNPERAQPTLAEMTRKSLELLEDSEKGFFLMVEGGQIDWAGHNNDTGSMLHEMIKFDEAVGVVREWAKGRDDTVVVMTADHETGGFGFSYSKYNKPEGRGLPGEAFKGKLFKPNFNFGDREVLDQIYAQKEGFEQMFWRFDGMPKEKKNSDTLAGMIREITGFPITREDAEKILAREPEEHHEKGHKHQGEKTIPKVCDFKEFYVYGDRVRCDLIGRAVAKYQNTVWATGTHTATPVTVTVSGPESLENEVRGIKTHAEVGDMMMRWIAGQPNVAVPSEK